MAESAERPPEVIESGGTAKLHLTLAVADYDHVRDLVSGAVRVDGVALTALAMNVEEIFFRFIKNREWDVSEMSFGKFIGFAGKGNSPYVGIPVFPSRVFRHSAFYVRTDRGIAKPKDLEGKRVAIPEWAQTAGIYARGYLAESAGVDLAKIKWVQAGVNQPGREEKVEFKLPSGMQYEQRKNKSITDMLSSGEVDAALSARTPNAFYEAGGKVARLFPEYRAEEMRYYKETGVFPIMHVIAMRRAVFDRYPWAAMNLLKAFTEAKDRGVARTRDLTVSRIPLPWCSDLAEEAAKTFGGDPYPYGLEGSRTTLSAFCRFAHAQGITPRLLTPDELFPKEVRAEAKV
jgi:4,5-dihydroxyphthalate decarboxylase